MKAPDKHYIYALICPISKKIRYVGKSKHPKRRYKQHIKDTGNETYKKLWLSKLKKKHLLPELVILDHAKNDNEARNLENINVLKNIETLYNIFLPAKKAPTLHDYRKANNINFDCEFELQKFDTDKYNKL